MLRRQLHREIRKPLILMTPKSLLRHKRAVSRLDELGKDTTFHRILYDDAQMLPDEKIKLVPDDKIRRVVLCSGKVYYDLYEEREKRGIDDIYLMRVEQLYPVPLKALVQELGRFKKRRSGLVPGRAAQHGRVALHRALSRMGAEPDQRAEQASALCRPRRVGGDRHRSDVEASGAAQGVAGRGAELNISESSCPAVRNATAGHPVRRAVRLIATVTAYWIACALRGAMTCRFMTASAITLEEKDHD